MATKIVTVSNDLNQVALGNLREQEQNLFFSILVKLKNKGHEPVLFTPFELNSMLSKHYTETQLTAFVKGLKEHFFKLDFRTEFYYENGGVAEESINLFKRMRIEYTDEKKTTVKSLLIEVNEQFEYMLNALKANFTSFELASFLTLNSKYSKTLFRLLKQYKTTGKACFEWAKFKELMGIPPYLKAVSRIEEVVLKPCVKDLSWNQLDLFKNYNGYEKPFFEDLTYKKIKKNPHGKTSPIVAVEFSFKPQIEEKELDKIAPADQAAEPQKAQTDTENEFLNMSAGEFASYYCTAMKDTKTDKTALICALGARQDKDEIGRLVEEMSRAERNARLNKELNNIK